MYCKKCGFKLSPEAKACPECGFPVDGRCEKKLKLNWLFWLGSVFVACAVLFFVFQCISAYREPEIAGVFLSLGGLMALVIAAPGIFFIWRSQKVAAKDLRYQPLEAQSKKNVHHCSVHASQLSCCYCGKRFASREWPVGGDKYHFSVEKTAGEFGTNINCACEHCGESNYIVWDEALEVKPLISVQNKINAELKSWSAGLFIMGGISLILSDVLNPVWGFWLIGIALIALIFRKPGVFLLIGCSLFVVGLMNLSLFMEEFHWANLVWGVLGGFQLYWGYQECRNYRIFRTMLQAEKQNKELDSGSLAG